jgi:ABC-type polysaccharide/polyol phosphate transport system ATPase subunit
MNQNPQVLEAPQAHATAEFPIELQDVSKVFRVVRREASLKSAALKAMMGRRPGREDFTALENVSFQIPRGQTVGVIGRNGSGKSTLLSLLARIYKPTSGSVSVRGRVATLLELGAGFHPEFTGEENVILNGVILGLSRKEMEARLPEIVRWADLGEQIQQQVKYFSSGMEARLGFSVAIHLDPQVLLVDEVLAVGDAPFQEKCYAKIEEFKRAGVTIFFVSHDMSAIRRVSDRVLWIHEHKLHRDGAPTQIVDEYEALAH